MTWRALVLAALLVGCTHRYVQKEYVIDTERIAPFQTGAPVRLVSDQPSSEEQIVFRNMGHKFLTDYAAVNDVLLAQLEKEIRKRGGAVTPDAAKVLRVTVIEMSGHAGFATLDASLRTRLQVGDAAPRELLVANTSPADVYRAFNGAIARTVMEILSDRQVLNFLASTPETPPVAGSTP